MAPELLLKERPWILFNPDCQADPDDNSDDYLEDDEGNKNAIPEIRHILIIVH